MPALPWLCLAALIVLGVAAPLPAQDFPQYGDDLYRPRLRQPGKDVMWLPTPDAMVERMLRMAKTTSSDVVYDLGAGDGKPHQLAADAVEGRLGEREGSFVLTSNGTFDGKVAAGEMAVIDGSGTGALAGIRGGGSFSAPLGSEATVELDYDL